MKRAIAAFLALALALSAEAKTLIVWDAVADVTYGSGASPVKASLAQVDAVRAILDRFGATYQVLPASVVRTTWANGGYIRHNEGTAGSYAEYFDAVIHVGYNGGENSRFPAGVCQPDSILRNASPVVPQLILLDDQLAGGEARNSAFDHSASRPTGIQASAGYQAPGGGSGNHEGEGTTFLATGPEQWFDAAYSSSLIKRTAATTNGLRVLLGSGMNSVFNTIERTGNMTTNPDSVGRSGADTMKVWVHQNLNGTGVKTIMASAFSLFVIDSASSAGLGTPTVAGSANWPVLMCAIAALDSAAGGRVLGSSSKSPVGMSFVITDAGKRGPRNRPGGFFSSDSNHVKASVDSLAAYGLRVSVAADPESLAVNAGDIAIWKRSGLVRFIPYVTTGIDSSSASAASTSRLPVDVWGRWRNRAFFGDSLHHSVNGADTSIATGLYAARNNLAALVGSSYMSRAIIAPQWDFSPKQMRVGQNHAQLDSLMWAVSRSGYSTLIAFVQGRDSDPQYLGTNPVGFLSSERTHTITTSSLAGSTVKVVGFTQFPVMGSSKFISPSVADTVPPYCDPICPGPNVAVAIENKFWNGFFPTAGRDYSFSSSDGFGNDQGVYLDSRDRLYAQSRASACVLPANMFGGGGLDYGFGHTNTAQTYPTRVGWLVFKHLSNVASAANKLAGRTIISVVYPEDIQP